MTELPPYTRIDVGAVREQTEAAQDHVEQVQVSRYGVRLWVAALAVVVSTTQAVLMIYLGSAYNTELAGSLIPTLGFGLLFVVVTVVNPLLRVVRKVWHSVPRELGRAELMLVFACMMVTSGVSTFGLVEVVVPQVAAPFNPDWNTPQRGWREMVIPSLNESLYITDEQVIRDYREGFTDHAPRPDAPWPDQAAYLWYVVWHVPWLQWARPLAWWSIFVAGAYVLFYSLSYLVLPFWVEREKLIFPLAKLPEALLPESDGSNNVLPTIMTTPVFWLGFIISFSILLWNGGFVRDSFAGLMPITLGMPTWTFGQLAAGTMFEHVAPSIGFLFLFTAMGLAFLLPTEMSFSVWFYFLMSKLLLLIFAMSGYYRSGDDPSNFLWKSSAVTSMAGGGLLMFSSVTLLYCLKQFGWLMRSRSWKERLLYGLPVFGLFGSGLVLTVWLSWCGLDPWWALGLVILITLMTLGLMRIVAESGLYWFQCNFGPFHLFDMLGMGRLVSAASFAIMLPIYSTLFLDHKCFLAPNMLNAAKLREDVGGSRVKFHVTLWVSLTVSILCSIAMSLVMAYHRGANRMHWWFYSRAQMWILDAARDMGNTIPHTHTRNLLWLAGGAAWVALTAYVRQSAFWFPHPLGFIMLVNPLMNQLWFSFFLAWVIKKIALRYGGKMTSDVLRNAFIGLILGELMAICFFVIRMFIVGEYPKLITLNRYGA